MDEKILLQVLILEFEMRWNATANFEGLKINEMRRSLRLRIS
jgi:hypothetical protein